MASYNRVVLLGNATRDVELKHTQSGTVLATVGLAANDRYKNKAGEWVDDPMFVDVTFWGRTAEVAAEYVRKGDPFLVEGRLKLDQWEKDGQKRSKHTVTADKLQLLGGKKGGESGGAPANRDSDSGSEPVGASSSFVDEEIPF